MPWFAARGNHDAAAQGFFTGRAGASIAVGCRKVMPPRGLPGEHARKSLDAMRIRLPVPGRFSWVPPDPGRRFVSARSFEAPARAHRPGTRVRPDTPGAAAGIGQRGQLLQLGPAARAALRLTRHRGRGGGSDGNLDHSQYRWLAGVLAQARRRSELVVVYGHHSLETMADRRPDELADGAGAACWPATPIRGAPRPSTSAEAGARACVCCCSPLPKSSST